MPSRVRVSVRQFVRRSARPSVGPSVSGSASRSVRRCDSQKVYSRLKKEKKKSQESIARASAHHSQGGLTGNYIYIIGGLLYWGNVSGTGNSHIDLTCPVCIHIT